jgi:hypothetical protein
LSSKERSFDPFCSAYVRHSQAELLGSESVREICALLDSVNSNRDWTTSRSRRAGAIENRGYPGACFTRSSVNGAWRSRFPVRAMTAFETTRWDRHLADAARMIIGLDNF